MRGENLLDQRRSRARHADDEYDAVSGRIGCRCNRRVECLLDGTRVRGKLLRVPAQLSASRRVRGHQSTERIFVAVVVLERFGERERGGHTIVFAELSAVQERFDCGDIVSTESHRAQRRKAIPSHRGFGSVAERAPIFGLCLVDVAREVQLARQHVARGDVVRLAPKRFAQHRHRLFDVAGAFQHLGKTQQRRDAQRLELYAAAKRVDRAFDIALLGQRAAEIDRNLRIVRTRSQHATQQFNAFNSCVPAGARRQRARAILPGVPARARATL